MFFLARDDLSEYAGLLFKNKSIIVPKVLRKEMLNIIHFNRLGINKCLARA